ncbi:MAG: UPF0149 family protein [Congregibacter sp.]
MSILDPHPGDSGAALFDELANALLEQGELLSPAELHGCLCGLLGGGFSGDGEQLLAELEKTLNMPFHGALADGVATLHAGALESFDQGDFEFQLLLPDDDVDLGQRIGSMASWCRSFLSGYAQARVSEGARSEPVAPDSAEVLRDFAAIAQAADDEDREGDDAEREYFELLEYLRVAAMNVLLDAGVGARD